MRDTHSAGTLTTWEGYASSHFIPFFKDDAGLTRERFGDYFKARLSEVLKVTVRKERTALRSFVEWALLHGEIPPPAYAPPAPNDPDQRDQWAQDVVNMMVPRLPKRGLGKPYSKRRRVAAFDLSPEQSRAVIRALPEWSASGKVERFPIRARFIVAYETSLRPSTLDRLLAPKHYQIGGTMLRLSADTDKARWARDVPLTKRARRVLDHVLRAYARAAGGEPYAGPIFGEHDYRQHMRAAASKALPPELAERFTGCHLRAHRVTHLLEQPSASLPGTQYMAGHKLVSTTAKYVKASFRAALETIGERESSTGKR